MVYISLLIQVQTERKVATKTFEYNNSEVWNNFFSYIKNL